MSERKTDINDAFALHSDMGGGINPSLENIGVSRGVRADSLPVNAYTAGDTTGRADEGLPEHLEASLPQRASRQFYPTDHRELGNYMGGAAPAYEVGQSQEPGQFSYPPSKRARGAEDLGAKRTTADDSGFRKTPEIGAPPGAGRLLEHLGQETAHSRGVQEVSLPMVAMPAGEPISVSLAGDTSAEKTLENVARVQVVAPAVAANSKKKKLNQKPNLG